MIEAGDGPEVRLVPDVVAVVLERRVARARREVRGRSIETAAHGAAMWGLTDVIRFLHESGVDLTREGYSYENSVAGDVDAGGTIALELVAGRSTRRPITLTVR